VFLTIRQHSLFREVWRIMHGVGGELRPAHQHGIRVSKGWYRAPPGPLLNCGRVRSAWAVGYATIGRIEQNSIDYDGIASGNFEAVILETGGKKRAFGLIRCSP
jgi:hypothetical protein